MAVYLGVDGGGTKTAFVLIDDTGRVLGSTEGPSAYHVEHGLPHVERVLADGMAELTAMSGVRADDVDFAFVAIPTHGEASHEVPVLDALPARMLGHHRYRTGNDMVAGWAGSLGLADGVNVVAGTGSIAYGERAGATARVGGWGELFGDEGSGHWIGLEALIAFGRMSDGRLPRTSLHDRVRAVAEVDADLDVIDVVLTTWGRSRGRIAALAPVVVAAADGGDPNAVDIVERAVGHLVDLVTATTTNLGFAADEVVPVSFSGGVFRARAVADRFATALGQTGHHELRRPRFPADVGAALYAAKTAGAPLGLEALDRLAASAHVAQGVTS